MVELFEQFGMADVGVVHGLPVKYTVMSDVSYAAAVNAHHAATAAVQKQWLGGTLDLVLATCAFGLGIDHPRYRTLDTNSMINSPLCSLPVHSLST